MSSQDLKTKISEFFTEHNTMHIVDEPDYSNFNNVIDTAKAVARATQHGVYLFDYYKRDVVYASQNMLSWCGITKSEFKKYGLEVYLKCIPEEDLKMLFVINNAAFEFFNKNISIKNLNYSLSYDFRACDFMVHQHYTPVLAKNDKIWVAMCIVTVSSTKKSGNIIMKTEHGNYEYSLKNGQWIPLSVVQLSHKEKLIIRYSSQGYSMKEIAKKTNSSEYTVKNQKQKLFNKLKVNSICEAVQYCVTNGLL